ncbi:uncharacterized protein LOC121308301 isoform X1 [Polyodon spathula]|uniref:uncharacterized protein LOC121308301 isoform X1 n=1 Tax=Polyodon spathula TaxID=7913 RepID=UPI001B7DC977|nr:uncharacterized protein LOC121308301 isoform X1 [Polyodon spathula]
MALETFPSDPLSPLHWNLTLLGASALVTMILLVLMCSPCGKRKSDKTSHPERSEGTELSSLPQTTAENEIWEQSTNASTADQPEQQINKAEKRNAADAKSKGKAKRKAGESDRPQKEESPETGSVTDADKDDRGKVQRVRELPELPGIARRVTRRHSSSNSLNVYDVVSEVRNVWPLDSRALCKQTSGGSNLYDEIRTVEVRWGPEMEDSKTIPVYTNINEPKPSGLSPQPLAQVGAAVPRPETQDMPLYAKVKKPRTRAVQSEIIIT